MSGLAPASERVRRHVWIAGRVQGVAFRVACAMEARSLEVDGWVRNLADGRVEAVFEGVPEAAEGLVAWCRGGPPGARVDQVEVVTELPSGEVGFRVI